MLLLDRLYLAQDAHSGYICTVSCLGAILEYPNNQAEENRNWGLVL